MSFPTVLIARKPEDKPTELELVMRSQASKFRVVQKLSGGAHLLLPGSDITIAVRTYHPSDLITPRFSDKSDALEGFRDAFKYPLVFFVLPPRLMQEQLSQMDSFVNRAQRIMNERAKTFCVSDTKSVVDTILVLLDALHPERRKLREKYYHHTQAMHYIGGNTTDQHHVSSHIKEEIRQLAQRLGLAAGEAEILMNELGTLRAISNADEAVLRDIPLEPESKRRLLIFFGSHDYPNSAMVSPHDIIHETISNDICMNDHDSFEDMFDYNNFQSSGQHDLIFAPQDTHPPIYTSQDTHPPLEMASLPPFNGFNDYNQHPSPFSSHGDTNYQNQGFASYDRSTFGGQQQHQEQQYMMQTQNLMHSSQLPLLPPQQQYYRPQSQYEQPPPTNYHYQGHLDVAPPQQQQYFPPQPEYQPPGSIRKFAGGLHRTPARAMRRFF